MCYLFLRCQTLYKFFVYGMSSNLKKVRSIFIEAFFIKEQCYQSYDKADLYRDEAQGKAKVRKSTQEVICMFSARCNEELSYASRSMCENTKLGWFESEVILNFILQFLLKTGFSNSKHFSGILRT